MIAYQKMGVVRQFIMYLLLDHDDVVIYHDMQVGR